MTDPGPLLAPADEPTGGTVVTITLNGRVDSVTHRPGTTILQTARQMGMNPPSQCEAGNCATCMARLVDGTVTMRCNEALDDDDLAEGWILTCQSEPTSPMVHVRYGFEED